MSFCCVMMWSFLLLALVLVQGEVFYVSKDLSDCPDNSICRTLNQYALYLSDLPVENNVFYFLNGTHFLNYSVVIGGVNQTFQGLAAMEQGPDINTMESPIQIVCSGDNVGIAVISAENIHMRNLTIKQCGKKYSSNTTSAVVFYNSINISMEYMSIQQSHAYGVFINTVAGVVISHSSFSGNNSLPFNVSAIVLLYLSANPMFNWTLGLYNTNITNENYGINLELLNNNYILDVEFRSLLLANNNVSISMSTNSTCKYNIAVKDTVIADSFIGFVFLQYACNDDLSIPNVSIVNSVITACRLNGMTFSSYGAASVILEINSTRFHNNIGAGAIAMQLSQYRQIETIYQQPFLIRLHNLTFDNNKMNHTLAEIIGLNPSFQVTVSIASINDVLFSNCTFSNNEASGLLLFNSRPIFTGINYFHNNTAYDGGGIFMITNSFLLLQSNALLSFVNNHATNNGGAINVVQTVLKSSETRNIAYCFYQLLDTVTQKYFYFENNTAGRAGTVIYGGATSSCVGNDFKYITDNYISEISTVVNQPGISVITSDAANICFCNSTLPNCSQRTLRFHGTPPGSSINFTVVIVGQHDNATTGVFRVHSDSFSSNQNLSSPECSTFQQTVTVRNASQTTLNIYITLTGVSSTPLTITIDIQPCPYDSVLSNTDGICECSEEVLKVATQCDPLSGIVTRQGTNWIGYNSYDNCTTVYTECPFDYCNFSTVKFPLYNPDLQCALNRSGTLCGECAEGLSLMLGTNQCGECNNGYIALIIPFALAGIILVVFLIVLNLTVSVGTVNGLIFYANVVQIYNPLLFGSLAVPIVGQFISWINLDLGIPTCFIDGMNSIIKTGLQFVFPFYIWFIICLIILWSRRSSRLSKAIGNNAVPVLATLLLLSYTKLLRTVILILSIATITCEDNADGVTHVRNIWYIDPNVTYLEDPRHLVLFIISLLVLVALIVPYTLFLLLFPVFELLRSKWSICTSLYLKLKPLFDAYAGPYNDHFRFWPGLLIAARVALALVVGLSSSFTVQLSVLVAVVVVMITMLSFGKIYKNYTYVLDICFLLCLFVLVYLMQGTLINNDDFFTFDEGTIGVAIVLALTLVVFIGIVGYHIYLLVSPRLMKMKSTMKSRIYNTSNVQQIKSDEISSIEVTYTTIAPVDKSLCELREPLLED